VVVTISGRPGSGKSVVASKVAQALNLRHMSAGDFMRQMAAERGMSILELSRVAEEGDEIDREIDARTMRLAEQGGDFVMDARLGWHFVPNSIKVFLEVDPLVAAQRIFEARRQSEVENVTIEETQRAVQDRTESERRRYLDYYGVDYGDHANYDLVIDTSELPIDRVVENVVAYVRSL
jgi:predicted cytidylate kinase